jgi:SpoVK/Ycf46/Vps4 family AAA+-type ATPase
MKFFLDLPREEEREEIFKIHIQEFDQIVGNYFD